MVLPSNVASIAELSGADGLEARNLPLSELDHRAILAGRELPHVDARPDRHADPSIVPLPIPAEKPAVRSPGSRGFGDGLLAG